MDVGQRLKELLNDKKILQKDLAKHLGVSVSYISDVTRGKKLPIDTLISICDYLDITMSEFFRPFSCEKQAPSYLQSFFETCSNLSQQDAEMLHLLAKRFLDPNTRSEQIPAPFVHQERKYSLKMPSPAKLTPAGKAAAGAAVYDDCTEESSVLLPIIYLNNERFFSVEVTGDSMEPKIKNGDIVIVAKNVMPESGQLALVRTASEEMDEYRIKIFHKLPDGIKLVSYNEEYPPVFIPKNEVLEAQAIVYVVHK